MLSKEEKLSGIVAGCQQDSDKQEVQNSAGCACVTLKALLGCLGARKWKRKLASAVKHSRQHSSTERRQPLASPGPGLLQDCAGSGHQPLVPARAPCRVMALAKFIISEGLEALHLYRVSIFKDT